MPGESAQEILKLRGQAKGTVASQAAPQTSREEGQSQRPRFPEEDDVHGSLRHLIGQLNRCEDATDADPGIELRIPKQIELLQ
jgi:hypothetical protein